ncbi:MAG: UDP-3-O-(3-hydroxymyristoyl)glucosamine N-acyltransferase [Pseudomonadota bacterium]
MHYKLGQLAEKLGVNLDGDTEYKVSRISTLANAGPDSITFMVDSRYRKSLEQSKAGAVILPPSEREFCQSNALISENPYLTYAHLTALFASRSDEEDERQSSIHATACVHQSATLGKGVRLGPHSVIGRDAVLGDGVSIGAGSVIGDKARIGDNSVIHANVTVYHDCIIGRRAVIHSGAVIGSDGFGFANDKGKWVKIHQLGRVITGDDVEIGANTSIDRGAIEDTLIENGVKLDNQIQIAHNVRIGSHTAMAGCVGVAGSADIGEHCAIGGGVGILGHLKITDGVTVTAMSLVPNSIETRGVYSSGTPLEPKSQWQRNYVRFKQLDEMSRRIRKLEKALNEKTKEG